MSPEGDVGLPAGLILSAGLEAHGASLRVVIIRTRSPTFPERARPLRGTEDRALIVVQDDMLSGTELLLKSCVLGEND